MISIKAKRPEEPPAPDAAQLYRKLQADAPPTARWPRILALALTAVALYLKSLVPGQARTDVAAPGQADPPSGEAAGRPALAESGEAPSMSGEEVDETGSVEAPADKAIGSGGPALGISGLPDFLNIESRLIDYDQLPLQRYPSPIIDAGPGFPASNDNGGRDFASNTIGGSDAGSSGRSGRTSLETGDGAGSAVDPDGSTRPAHGTVPGSNPRGDGDPDGNDDGAPPSEEPRNRAPRLAGPVQLVDIGGCQTLLIASLALLAGATDADATPLAVAGLRVSHGQLTVTEGGWVFKPPADWFGTVTLSYWVSDGEAFVQQTATLRVLEFLEVTGTTGDDLLLGSDCADRIAGLGGDDIIDARGGSDIVVGGAGNDRVFGGAGHDRIDAGAGDDIVFGGAGNDVIHGGTGNDSLHGSDGNDTIFGGAGRDVITGGDGDDIIDAGEGDDVVDGGSGDNIIDAGAGDDTVTAGDGDNTVLAGDGSDHVTLGGGDDVVKAGAGDDEVATGAGDDRAFGEEGNDVLAGDTGKDLLDGGPGEDRVEGGPDDDVVVATSDTTSDCYDGGKGQDTLDLSHTEQGVTVDLKRSMAVGIEIGSDTVIDFETILGGKGDDCMIVGEKATTLKGGGGNDRFVFAVEGEAKTEELVHKILDLEAGDRIVVKQYEIGLRRDGDDDRRGVEVDRFGKVYGDDNDDRPFRFRIEKIGEDERTYVDVYIEREGAKDFSIEVYGNHKFYYF